MATTSDECKGELLTGGAIPEWSVSVLSAHLCFALTIASWLKPGLGAQRCHLTAVLHWPIPRGLSSLIYKVVMITFSMWLIR